MAPDTSFEVYLLAGFKQGKLMAEGGLYVGSLDESETKVIGATVGTTF